MPKTPFNEKHCAVYGLKIAHMDSNWRIDSVVCRFCTAFGRGEEDGDEEAPKRKRTSNAKYFSSFRVDNYKVHLSKQHPCKWLEYQKISFDSEEVSTF
jgi:hypothetical protein